MPAAAPLADDRAGVRRVALNIDRHLPLREERGFDAVRVESGFVVALLTGAFAAAFEKHVQRASAFGQSLLAALDHARSHGVAVRLSTRCAEGQIVGVPVAGQTAEPGLNAYKARIDLMLDLMA